MSIRTEKVAGEIQKALARPLRDVASEISAGFITATHVRMSPDLRLARVYLSVFGGKASPQQTMTYIETRAKEIRRSVVAQVRLRFAPELRFYLDDTLDVMNRVDELIKAMPKYSTSDDTSNDASDDTSNDARRLQ
jgi:ribosome-binding factor A